MTGKPAREWSDADDISLALYMQRDIGLPRIGREIVSQAVVAMAYRNERNCVRAWLEALEHDWTSRVDSFFSDCFGADETEYTKAASRNFWLSMIARVFEPGCKVDNMIVLEGAQGVGKSTALQVIGGEWFAEQHESATNPKAFAEILQGKWLIEISEMDSFNRAEVNRVKQTVSCPSDRFRASYGRHAKDHPRQCVFVGTTNRDDWNRDETGARRFWPISCRGTVRVDLVRQNREQLFAEAVARYKAGEPHWMMPAEATKAEQEGRFQADPWLDNITTIVKGESNVTTSFVAEKLGIDLARRDRAVEMRIGACLRFMGWKRQQKRGSDSRAYVYNRPEA
jgi:putative DNA primase/helicase